MSGSDAPAPYVGLVPFSAADADYFFGRERETELVVATLSSRRLTLLFGPSGVGKSSLLRAGVLHRLQQGARSRLDRLGRDSEAVRQVVEGRPARATVRVGALPIAGRVAAGAGRHEAVDGVTPTLVMHADEERLVPALPPVPVVVSDWRDDPASLLAERLRDAVTELYGPVAGPDIAPDADVPTLLRAWSAHVRADLYLVLDQFDEFFLWHSAGEPGGFAGQLAEAVADPATRTNVLLSLREDNLAELDALREHIPNLFGNCVRLAYMDRAAARCAIVGPILRHNTRVPQAERARIAAAPAAGGDGAPGSPAGDRCLSGVEESSALTAPEAQGLDLVQHVLDQVRTASAMAESTRGAEAGGAAPQHERDRVETPYLQLVMTRLWDEETRRWEDGGRTGTRVLRATTLDALGGAERIVAEHLTEVLGNDPERCALAARVLERLVTSQGRKIALTVEELAGPATADVQRIHELVRYLEARSVVRNAGPPPGQTETARNRRWEITHDVLAAAAGQWRTEYLQREAARAAEAEHDAAVRRAEARLRRRAAWAAFVLGVVVLGAAVGLDWWRRSQNALRREQAQGLSNTLAALARFQLPLDAGLAAALANVADSINSRDETLGLLQRAVFEPVNTFSFGTGGQPIVALEPLRDGRFFVATLDGRVFIRDSAGPAAPVAVVPGPLEAAVLLPGGQAVAVAARRPARILRTALGDTLNVEMPGHTERIYSLAVEPDGSLLSVGHDGRVIRHRSIGAPIIIGQQREAAVAVAASSNGMLVAGGEGGMLRLWSKGAPLFNYSLKHRGWITSLSFSAGDTLLVTAARDTAVRLWRVQRRDPQPPVLVHLGQLRGHTGWLSSAVFSADNRHVLTSSADGTARVWETASGLQVAMLPHPARVGVRSARFLDDGRIVTAGEDGVIRLWGWTLRSPVAVAQRVEIDSTRTRPQVLARGGGVELVLVQGSRELYLRRAGTAGTIPLMAHRHDAKERGMVVAAVSPTGRRVATIDGEDSVRIWDGSTGAFRRAFSIGEESIEGLAFTPDGLRLIGVTGDGTSYAWNLDGAQRARVDPAYDPSVIVPGATPWMLVPRRGQAQVYACDVCRPRDTLKQRFPSHLRSLTPVERARYLGSSKAP